MKHNAADESQVKEKDKSAKLKKRQLNADYQEILKTPAGFRYFKHFFREGGMLGTSMTGNSWTFFKEGQRACVDKVWKELTEADPNSAAKLFIELTKEAKDEQI